MFKNLSSSSKSATETSKALRLGNTTKCFPEWISGKMPCNAARSRRFNLFLITALFDNFLLTIIPAFGNSFVLRPSPFVLRINIPINLPGTIWPSLITCLNSSLESLNFLGSTYLPFLLVFTAILIRPLRRRSRKIFLPLLVEILFLNPCARARWTLEG